MTTEQPAPTAAASDVTALQRLDFVDLRNYRNELKAEEEKVSYWRRLVHHRMDLIRKQATLPDISARDLLKSLGETVTGARRQQLLSVEGHEPPSNFPTLEDLWAKSVDTRDSEATERLLTELISVERELSEYRTWLHERIDASTTELISRYRANPNLSLDLFPQQV